MGKQGDLISNRPQIVICRPTVIHDSQRVGPESNTILCFRVGTQFFDRKIILLSILDIISVKDPCCQHCLVRYVSSEEDGTHLIVISPASSS